MGWYCPPERIKSQGGRSTCGANALAMASELYFERLTGKFRRLSAASVSAFQPDKNSAADGISNFNLATVAIQYGIAEYDLLPYDLEDYEIEDYVQDATYLTENALQYRFKAFEFTRDIEKVKKALEFCPVILSTAISNQFYQLTPANHKLVSDFKANGLKYDGWHYLVVAADEKEEKCFRLINSHGKTWGKDGTCLMPYDYNNSIPMAQYLILIPYKELENVKVKEQLLVRNRSEEPLKPRGFVIHSTATEGATAQNEYIYFNTNDLQASAHYFVDWQEIIRTVPENEKAWHAGPTANSKYLSAEMCEPKGYDEEKFNEVWRRTVWLVADACVRYGWTTKDIFSHEYMSLTYKETNHIDPIPYLKKYGRTWAQLLTAISNEIKRLKGDDDVLEHAVMYFSTRDYSVADIVAEKLGGCATFNRNRNNASVHPSAKSAKHLVVVGGAPVTDHPNATNLCGQHAPETALLAAQYAMKL